MIRSNSLEHHRGPILPEEKVAANAISIVRDILLAFYGVQVPAKGKHKTAILTECTDSDEKKIEYTSLSYSPVLERCIKMLIVTQECKESCL